MFTLFTSFKIPRVQKKKKIFFENGPESTYVCRKFLISTPIKRIEGRIIKFYNYIWSGMSLSGLIENLKMERE